MKIHIRKKVMALTAFGLGILFLTGCGGYNMIVKMPEVNKVPKDKFEKIIKLDEPENMPEEQIVGMVYLMKGANVCVDFPRQELIKSLDVLNSFERQRVRFFGDYAITSEGKTIGYVSVSQAYRATLWENEKEETCRYKVEIEAVNKESIGKTGAPGVYGTGHGGGHGR